MFLGLTVLVLTVEISSLIMIHLSATNRENYFQSSLFWFTWQEEKMKKKGVLEFKMKKSMKFVHLQESFLTKDMNMKDGHMLRAKKCSWGLSSFTLLKKALKIRGLLSFLTERATSKRKPIMSTVTISSQMSSKSTQMIFLTMQPNCVTYWLIKRMKFCQKLYRIRKSIQFKESIWWKKT